MNLRLVTAPAKEPVSVQEAKDHLKILHALEDGYIGSLVKAATKMAEDFLNRALIEQEWELLFDFFPRSPINIPLPPLQSIDSVKYIDSEGVLQTLAPSEYETDTAGFIGRLSLRDGKSWPSTKRTTNAVVVAFTAGYGDDPGNVPEPIRQGIKVAVAALYENREEAKLPFAAESLLWPYRVFNF